MGVNFREHAPMGISRQNTLLNNFSPVQPSLSCNTPIDSVQLAKTRGIIKHFSNFILGELPGKFQKITPSMNFQTVKSDSQNKLND
jgi:hypothetical protein